MPLKVADNAGNIYFSAVPSEVVRFNLALADYEVPALFPQFGAEPFTLEREQEDDVSLDTFDGYLVFRPNSKHLAIADRDLAVPAGAELLGIGDQPIASEGDE